MKTCGRIAMDPRKMENDKRRSTREEEHDEHLICILPD
jgi:hypothetical protein